MTLDMNAGFLVLPLLTLQAHYIITEDELILSATTGEAKHFSVAVKQKICQTLVAHTYNPSYPEAKIRRITV
jgi:hypothetical protein